MALHILQDRCTLCSRCIEECPFQALEIREKKLYVLDACTDCGACVKVCPEKALLIEEKRVAADTSAHRGIWFFVEHRKNRVRSASLEMLGACLKLKEKLGEEIGAVLIGDGVEPLAAELVSRGADRVYLVEHPCLRHFQEETYSSVFTQLILTHRPSIVLAAATMIGRAFLPSVAAQVRTGLTADCTGIDIDPEKKLLVQTRPTFGGNLMAKIVCENHRPQMATVRPKIYNEPAPRPGATGTVLRQEWSPDGPVRVSLLSQEEAQTTIDLQEAEIIISGGRGLGEGKNFAMIREFAGLLGAAVGASRAAVDSGWIPYPHQVGQTGKTVKPKIYIACGISGAIQHLAGMQTSDYIIAINRDADAPILKAANFGIVGDIFEVIPRVIRKLQQSKGG